MDNPPSVSHGSQETLFNRRTTIIPVFIALVLLAGGGWFLLDRAEAQARDTTRKHHLEDLENALFVARTQHGTYPPYDQPSWCGLLNDPNNEPVRVQIEQALRKQNDKYANPDKPFPQDPLIAGQRSGGYFYWKRSPAIFELYALLEADANSERSTAGCNNNTNAEVLQYDYGLTSVWREIS